MDTISISDVAQKLFATWWAIAFGIAVVNYMYHPDQHSHWVGIIVYPLLFIHTIFEIKTKQSVFMWLWRRRQKRRQEEEEYVRRWNH